MTISILAAALLVQPAQGPPAGGASGQWVLAASDEGAEDWLDMASLRKDGAVYRFRMRHRARESGPGEVQTALIHYQLDCSARTIAMESLEAFDVAGAVVLTRTIPADWLDREPIYAGSVPAQYYARVCPASARRQLAQQPPPPPVMMVAPPIQYMPPPIAPPPPPPPVPPPPRYPVKHATPVEPLGSLITADDYPAAALRAEEQGTVFYRMTIDRRGRVIDCQIMSSSGSASLDSATCRLIRARARFHPARGGKGKKITDVQSGRIMWRIPYDAPLPPPAPPAQ